MDRKFGFYLDRSYGSEENSKPQGTQLVNQHLVLGGTTPCSRPRVGRSISSHSSVSDIPHFNQNIYSQGAKEFEFKLFLSQIRDQLLLHSNDGPEFEEMFTLYCDSMISAELRVEPGLVGLVVGPKGETIKRIQKKTNTFILTPSKNKDPLFLIHGQPDDVEEAKEAILNHISLRTQSWQSTDALDVRYSVQPSEKNPIEELKGLDNLATRRWSQVRSMYDFLSISSANDARDSAIFVSMSSRSGVSSAGIGYAEYDGSKFIQSRNLYSVTNNSVFEQIPQNILEGLQKDSSFCCPYEKNEEEENEAEENDSSSSLPTNDEIEILLSAMRSDITLERSKFYPRAPGMNRSVFRFTLDFCLLCFSSDIEYSFLPCGHSPFCKSCGLTFLNKTCLVCTERVDELQLIDLKMYNRTFY